MDEGNPVYLLLNVCDGKRGDRITKTTHFHKLIQLSKIAYLGCGKHTQENNLEGSNQIRYKIQDSKKSLEVHIEMENNVEHMCHNVMKQQTSKNTSSKKMPCALHA